MPNISYLTLDLRSLLKKEKSFQGPKAHDVVFQKIKNHMSENVCDRYFDTTKDVVLYVDFYQVGLDAVFYNMVSQWHMNQKAGSSQSEVCQYWEKMLAIVSGYLKYQYYLYGRRFVYKSDHQCLEMFT